MKDMLDYLMSVFKVLAHNVLVYVVNKLRSSKCRNNIHKEANYAKRSNEQQPESKE